MKIGIIGLGIVGSAVYDGLSQIGHSMCYFDISRKESSLSDIAHTDLVYVCVPTETVGDHCDLSQVRSTMESLSKLGYQGTIAIKSTVLPGTTQQLISDYPHLEICFVPEFLRAKSALTDFVNEHDVLVVGTDDAGVYDKVVKSHGIIPKSCMMVSPTDAEMIKYFSNVYNALRIVFANSMYEVCQAVGADYQNVLGAVTRRRDISPNYLQCSDNYKGFGGHCLPKDTQAFESFAKSLGLNADLFTVIVNLNKKFI
jgi:UDPglucose 6-dehydrogenase